MSFDRIALYSNLLPYHAREVCVRDPTMPYENRSVLVSSFMQQNKPWCMWEYGLTYYEMEVVLTELHQSLLRNPHSAAVVELGVGIGWTSTYISKFLDSYVLATKRQRPAFHIFDSFSGQPFPECENYTNPEDEFCGWSKVSPAVKHVDTRPYIGARMWHRGASLPDAMHRGFFAEIRAEEYPSNIAFALFDSDTERSIRDSFIRVFPNMKQSGTIVLHDYGNLPGVPAAAKKYLNASGFQVKGAIETKSPGRLGIVHLASLRKQKRKAPP